MDGSSLIATVMPAATVITLLTGIALPFIAARTGKIGAVTDTRPA